MPTPTQTTDEILDGFEAMWRDGSPPDMVGYWASIDPALRQLPLLHELVKIDLDWRHQLAARRDVVDGDASTLQADESSADDSSIAWLLEDYQQRLPELGSLADLPVDLLAEEYRVRHRWGDGPSHESYVERFGHRDAMEAELQQVDRMLDRERPAQSPQTERFELLERLGSGAFGTVWKARDRTLDRVVAIKVPRVAEINADELELFLREARAAAQLQHPNIVALYEVVESDAQVVIVSQFIPGVALEEWRCGSQRDIAELIATISDALHHAHEAGVVHRDLKPANILMDHHGQPHLADFGLAKREHNEATRTLAGAILGTPAYMSPEQARGEGHSADRRSDIFSLGVILYELLTGARPFRGTHLLQRIQDEEPLPPRRLEPAAARDLETVCLKCIEKAPAERYATAGEVADEMRRYLRGEPIHARPLSRLHRLMRWSKRHPYVAGSIALAACLLITLTGATAMLTQAYQTELELRRDSQGNYELARNAVEDFAGNVFANRRLDAGTRQGMYRVARDYYRAFVQRNRDDPALRPDRLRGTLRLARIEFELGNLDECILLARNVQQEIESADANDLAELQGEALTLTAWSRAALGQYAPAEVDIDQAIAVYRSLAESASEPVADRGKSGLAMALHHRAEFDLLQGRPRAAARFQEALDTAAGVVAGRGDLEHALLMINIRQSLGSARMLLGETDAAKSDYDQAETALKAVGKDDLRHPDVLYARGRLRVSLAHWHKNQGDVGNAKHYFELAIEDYSTIADRQQLVPEYRRSLADTFSSIGIVLMDDLGSAAAEPLMKRGIELFRQLRAHEPLNHQYTNSMSNLHSHLGILYKRQGKWTEAEKQYSQAMELAQLAVDQCPELAEYRSALARACMNLGNVYTEQAKFKLADEALRKAIEHREAVVAMFPDVPTYQSRLAMAHDSRGVYDLRQARPADAVASFDAAIAIYRQLVDRKGASIDETLGLVGVLTRKAAAQMRTLNPDGLRDAESTLLEAIRHCVATGDEHLQVSSRLARCYQNLAKVYLLLDKPAEAAERYSQAISRLDALLARDPNDRSHRNSKAACQLGLGDVHSSQERDTHAVEQYKAGIDTLSAIPDSTATVEVFVLRGVAFRSLGLLHGPTAEGNACLLQSVACFETAQARSADAHFYLEAAVSQGGLADQLVKQGKLLEALAALDKAVELAKGTSEVPVVHYLRRQRARCAANAGRHALAIREALALAKVYEQDPASLVELAHCCGVAHGKVLQDQMLTETERQKLALDYASQALKLARRAAELGGFADNKRLDEFREDPRLESLRATAGFASLFKELKAP